MVNIRPGVMFLPVFHKDQSLAPFCFLFISMIYLMVFSVTQNCFQIIPNTSLFPTVHNIKKATNDLNNDLNQNHEMVFPVENEL